MQNATTYGLQSNKRVGAKGCARAFEALLRLLLRDEAAVVMCFWLKEAAEKSGRGGCASLTTF